MRYYVYLICVFLVIGCSSHKQKLTTEVDFENFLDAHILALAPLETQAGQAYWDGATQGSKEAFARREQLQLEIQALYQNKEHFQYLKDLRESGCIQSPPLKRQLDKLYYAFLRVQVEPELAQAIVTLDTRIQEVYSQYRGTIEGEAVTMSDIYILMTTEGNTAKRKAAWLASKQVGNVIIEDLLKLVRLRNQAAQQAGYADYHALTIETQEQSVNTIDKLFAELEAQTREPFRRLKEDLDRRLAEGYDIDVKDLMPWHYHDPFFQRSPLVFALDLDQYYQGQDIEKLSRDYFAGVGLSVDDILGRSDLYDREGKYPHAFSHEIGREGDVRILCNLQDTERWMETQLHELGHAIYSKYHDRSEPWLFRQPAHAFTTEAVAMFFGRLSRNADWMQIMLGLDEAEKARVAEVSGRYLQFQQVLFARWAMVMYYFEKALYTNPEQDLNSLWWDLVEQYQFVKRPPGPVDAGWASKLHFTSAPCYYHNYLLGELLASQFEYIVTTKVLKEQNSTTLSYTNDPRIGNYFKTEVFAPGAKYTWNDMIERATGEPLTSTYFVQQFLTNVQ